MARVTRDGKQFAVDGRPFRYRGVTYGTFQPRDGDGERFPTPQRVATDFAAIAAAGFTVVRTYTPPPDDVLDLAAEHGLHLQSDVFWPDWRYLVAGAAQGRRAMAREARAAVQEAARRCADRDQVLALSLGNEIPADAIRWFGTRAVAGLLDDLAGVARDAAPDLLVTYANYPTAEYLPLDTLDFLTFNVFLERRGDLRRYLTRLHHLAGDRPLVIGEMGLDSRGTPDGEASQAQALQWQLGTMLERGVAGFNVFSWTDEWWVGDNPVEGWHFGLTRADRSPRPALAVAQRWNGRTVADLDPAWPGISVVICAYNAAATLDECLRHTCALDYPDLEILVVDDGSADATADIARRHPRARLVSIPHAGLGTARNAGIAAATRSIVAYLDSDAYPSPEWPYHLALAFDSEAVVGAGGPNVPPPDDPPSAHRVAHAPGGPVHVLLSDDRAEHVPGCNMAFYKTILEQVGGFDPVYTAAGDDVDICWKVLDAGWSIGFHPAALVWHHRRPGLRTYLRQQRGYGRSEALVEARHPDRFTPLGTARWRGRIYDSFPVPLGRQRVYRGQFGAAAYQSVYRGGGHLTDLLHQAGLPLAALTMLTAPLGLLRHLLLLPSLLGLLFVAALFSYDVMRFGPPRNQVGGHPLSFRLTVALLHVLQPLVRTWARVRNTAAIRREHQPALEPLPPAQRTARSAWLLPADRARPDTTAAVIAALRSRSRIAVSTGWADHDAVLDASTLVRAELLTSGTPVGTVQVRIRHRLRPLRLALVAALMVVLALVARELAAFVVVLTVAELGRGLLLPTRRLALALRADGGGSPLRSEPEPADELAFTPEEAPRTPAGVA